MTPFFLPRLPQPASESKPKSPNLSRVLTRTQNPFTFHPPSNQTRANDIHPIIHPHHSLRQDRPNQKGKAKYFTLQLSSAQLSSWHISPFPKTNPHWSKLARRSRSSGQRRIKMTAPSEIRVGKLMLPEQYLKRCFVGATAKSSCFCCRRGQL